MRRASLNHAYRVFWSEHIGAFVAVAETTKARGKSGARACLAIIVAGMGMSAPAWAADLPVNGQISAGSGSISQSGNTMSIQQNSDKLAINWQSFSIGQGNTVNFVQPGAASVALNRVTGSEVSTIQGALNANGQVFLINPNGVLFTPTAQVNVGGWWRRRY